MNIAFKNLFSKPNFWLHMQTLLISIIWWCIFFRLFVILQYIMLVEKEKLDIVPHIFQLFHDRFFISLLMISLFAFISWLVEVFIFTNISRRKNFIVSFSLKLFAFVIGFFLFGLIIGLFYYIVGKDLSFYFAVNQLDEFFLNSSGLCFFIVGIIVKYSLDIFLSSMRRTGFSMYWRILFGRYKKPFEENRIFIFLDLVSSTKFAQILGHEKYSAFLQECFHTISNSIVNTRGIIYQFVGDEVVVTWNGDNEINYQRAVEFYFQFSYDLKNKEKLFLDKFGVLPQFTASLNAGKVMVAEVGDLKTEIAYHGDVLNTAARLQKQCKKYDVPLLATENYIYNLDHSIRTKYIDNVLLAGKEKSEKIFEVKKP